MKLELHRLECGKDYTIGELFVDGTRECWVLEDAYRLEKVYGETCIPNGEYVVKLTFSNRFGQIMPDLLDVPGFTGIRIHPGNTTGDTHGCLLVGLGRNGKTIIQSRAAYTALFDKMELAAKDMEPIWIVIDGGEVA